MNSDMPESPHVQPEADEFRDQLPSDLNAVEHVGVHQFPDNSRRKVPGTIYLVTGSIFIALTLIIGDSGPFINQGMVTGGVILALLVFFASHQVGK